MGAISQHRKYAATLEQRVASLEDTVAQLVDQLGGKEPAPPAPKPGPAKKAAPAARRNDDQ